ncbi:RluA family pseudouridine synthase [Myxococcota bacterium]|nr:RluA family pseudouridine synthase [Myxococcota bacterium]MBU1379640.1 RluA family pseudouridine synthase [Myxococcota bacterium]MBU1498003.1 RluA family pseudouridine synthase [Myxococcota bacterium]
MKHEVTERTTLMEFLSKVYPDSPATRIKKLLKSGNIRLRGQVITHYAHTLEAGDEIEIAEYTKRTTEAPFKILYEDDWLVAIDKPPGINTSSADNAPSCSAVFTEWYRDNSKGRIRVYVVHRLDKEVSGVLLFAKSESVMEQLSENWEKTEKRYMAIVEGKPPKPEGIHSSWLLENEFQRMYSVKNEEEGAKFAKTQYRTTGTVGDYTILEITLHTGRKNQIRVHMRDLGCPIVGDRRYGAERKYVRRIRLHSIYLSLPHPVTEKTVVIESKPPGSFFHFKQADEDYK